MAAGHDTVAGLLLAAGAGRRMGGPKALVRDENGTPWVVRAAHALAGGGCDPVLVVVGAQAPAVAATLHGQPVEVIEADGWREGMGASLRTGLTELSRRRTRAVAALVAPVDVPGLSADVVRRFAERARPDALARAVYDGRPGHPVLIGRDHWDGVLAQAAGDQGARAYLGAHGAAEIECSDLADGTDVDTADQLPAGHRPWQGSGPA
jgi:CTP:molybdopterin cytidylyltransferase MocA